MPAGLLAEWQEYDRLEPFGSWRDNWNVAVVATVLANVNRDPKKRATPFTPADFMYLDPETREEQDAQRRDLETLAMFERLAGNTDGSRSSEVRGVAGSSDPEVSAGLGRGESQARQVQ